MTTPTCKVVPTGPSYVGQQGFTYLTGLTGATVGSRGLSMTVLTLPDGARARTHLHHQIETGAYIIEGRAEMYFGARLEHHLEAVKGEYVYVPANTPHLVMNRSGAPCLVLVAHSASDDQAGIELLPELDGLIPLSPRAPLRLRPAVTSDIPALAQVWYDGWHEAHAHLLPADLTALRTLPSFVERLPALLPDTTVAEVDGHAIGFCIIEKDELYQLYLARTGRGSGVAAALVADAEARLAAHGVRTAWLACAIGNDRAGHFYEKCGWRRVGTMTNPAFTPSGPYPLETWRYEKELGGM